MICDDVAGTHIVVHDMKPPFLDGRVVYSKQSEPVMPLKDPTSDMAVCSKKGSQLMRDVRERRERERATKDKFNMAGTVIGNILGVKAEAPDESTTRSDVQVRSTLPHHPVPPSPPHHPMPRL